MNIAIDIRPLLDARLTGVGQYTYNLVNYLLKYDTKNTYFLFYNNFRKSKEKTTYLPSIKTPHQYCEFSIPNKVFNSLIKFGGINIDTLINKKFNTNIDLFLFPNLSFIKTSTSCKQIVTVHDLSFKINPNFFSWKQRFWHNAINPKKILQQSNHIISVSKNTKKDIIDIYSISENKITFIHLGINKQYKNIQDPNILENIKQKYKLPSKFIFFLGTLEPRKNIISLIQAFDYVTHDHDLVIAGGNGWKYKNIYDIAKKSKKKHKIHFLGYVDNKDKPGLYNCADLFVYTSFYEGFGFPPLEAAACHCPVITSPGSSIGEINNDSVMYANPYNIKHLSSTINEVLDSNNLQKKLIKKGHINSQQFTWDKTIEKTLQLINSLN